ncbi:hypothetical protein BDN70DRAFT_995166 [Pholiota conissans]|uniref:F-box domain-containing protein n=1 Tax=Pholiota conissans TaxID=109636 RepID=A0A9P5YWR1_9AGAR|nr:hypothetical protein BDN70DRAFT_995166 [Pholiota conissans]
MSTDDALDLPDDVWIDIFELIPPRQLAANVQKTCTRFYFLAVRALLRHIHWVTPAQIEDALKLWGNTYSNRTLLPKWLWIGPVLESQSRDPLAIRILNLDPQFYRRIALQVSYFCSLQTFSISGMSYSDDIYRVLVNIPTLRDLRIIQCEYVMAASTPVQGLLPITHLRLHNNKIINQSSAIPNKSHPLSLLTCPNLTHLAISWDDLTAESYRFIIHDPLGKNHFNHKPIALATRKAPRASPNLRCVEIYIPHLDYTRFDGLISLTSPPPTSSDVRVKIRIGKSVLSAEECRSLASALQERHRLPVHTFINNVSQYGGVGGVWSYDGPFECFNVFPAPRKKVWDHQARTSVVDVDAASDNLFTPLTHMRLTPPSESVQGIVVRLEQLRHPLQLKYLEVCVDNLDMEILYAIRELCPNVQEIVVRYTMGRLIDEDFAIRLGASILPGLHHLRTLRIRYDALCISTPEKTSRQPCVGRPPVEDLPIRNGDTKNPARRAKKHASSALLRSQLSAAAPRAGNTDAFLYSYLVAWQRYCPELRRVQLGGVGVAWRRRWAGEKWRRSWVEDAKGEWGADFEWDESDEEDIWVDINDT